MKMKIGIRPIIDGRWGGIREGLEEQTMSMARRAKELIEKNVFYSDSSPCECVIADSTIGGGAEAARCEEKFIKENVVATLSVTPCWCYGTETMDLNPLTVKAVWGFNGTERPGAVYLAAAMAAHTQRNLPAFAIYGKDVQDANDETIPDDVQEKILRFARCAVAVGQMKNKAYVGIGSVAMGIAGSFLNPDLMQNYFGIRAEWVDMTEILRRVDLEIYDKQEYEKAFAWAKKNLIMGEDYNVKMWNNPPLSDKQKEDNFAFTIKMTLIIRDIMLGNEKLHDIGRHEEALGRNAVLGGFQGQRMWTDYKPNADFTEAILNTSFDWNGKREPVILATENDTLNGISMLFLKLLTNQPAVFSDVRTYWSPRAVERVTKWKPDGIAKDGFIHLINSGASALDGNGAIKDEKGNSIMKKWWEINDKDMSEMLKITEWSPANTGYFRGGGFSSKYSAIGQMPITMIRLNMISDTPFLQIAEGWTVELPKDVNSTLLDRTDPTWPSIWFVPRLSKSNPAFKDVYTVMSKWGANHGASTYGHIGKDIITLASMLRIPVAMHNVEDDLFRPHAWNAFGTKDEEGADFRACEKYKALYK